MRTSTMLLASAMPMLLAGCGDGGGSGSVASTPVVSAAAPTPTPVAVPPVAINYDSPEYRRSNAAVQAQALAAYSAGATGSGVLVGVIDSGIATANSEFAGRISPLSRDYAGNGGIEDAGGHGTAVSDILLGARNDSGISGVAFDATLLALRTDTPGSCTTGSMSSDATGCSHNDSAIAAALDGAVAAQARVVNISLGGAPANMALRAAIGRATAAGIIIVISGGNDGVKNPALATDPDLLAQIAIDPVAHGLVIIAGAVDASGALADFANKAGNGAAFYLSALGVGVRAIDNTGKSFLFSGTSFSAPVIAGAAALLMQAFPTMTPAQVVALLYRTATDRGAAGVDGVYGNGELNLARAFQPQGASALAGSAVAVSLSSNATMGAAMGDAARSGLAATIRDGYGRDFAVDLGATVRSGGVAPTLAAGLANGTRTLAALGARTSMALAIDDRGPQPQPLLLRRGDLAQARVLAGAMTMAVSRTTTLGLGIGRSAGLAAADDGSSAAFLVGDHTLDRSVTGGMALRRGTPALGLTIAAESGDVKLWEAGDAGPRLNGLRRYRYSQLSLTSDATFGPLRATAGLTRMVEGETILGSRFGPALGGNGATSWFADAGLAIAPAFGWRLRGSWRQGWTQVAGNGLRGSSTIASRALAVALEHRGVALRYAEPLRVTGGGLALTLPGTEAHYVSLAPIGHERDVEAVYATAVGGGTLTANGYWRRQAGNIASAPVDIGAALRWSAGF